METSRRTLKVCYRTGLNFVQCDARLACAYLQQAPLRSWQANAGAVPLLPPERRPQAALHVAVLPRPQEVPGRRSPLLTDNWTSCAGRH